MNPHTLLSSFMSSVSTSSDSKTVGTVSSSVSGIGVSGGTSSLGPWGLGGWASGPVSAQGGYQPFPQQWQGNPQGYGYAQGPYGYPQGFGLGQVGLGQFGPAPGTVPVNVGQFGQNTFGQG